ncbi:MAG: hypothetical protein ACI8RD_013960 [Bacillariaceae sp.]|jgi:hypothetical protein
MRPSLDSFKQASSNALSKAQLMVGLNGSNSGDGLDNTNDDIELAGSNNSKNGESNNSEGTPTLVEEAAELLCPELTFQQRLLGFATCFTIACKYNTITLYRTSIIVSIVEIFWLPFFFNV